MKLRSVFSIVTAVVSLSCYAGDMQKAAEYYSQGDYEQSVEEYESILASGQESATLYYNLGNSYFRLGKMSKAIINYERSLKVDPTNEDARHNLEFAKEKTVDKIDVPEEMFITRWWSNVRNLASADAWAYSSIALFSLFVIALLCYIFSTRLSLKKSGFALSLVALVFSAVTFVLAYQQNAIQTDNSHAIIFAPTVTIKSTPDVSGTDLFILHEGTKVEIREYVGSWAEIVTEDGSKGWIDVNAIEII